MIERIVVYAIILMAIIASVAYIINGIMSVFKKKKSFCNCCEIEKNCKKRKK